MNGLAGFLKFDIDEDNLPVRREQVRARIACYPTMILPAMAIVPLLAWVMWEEVSHQVLLWWMALAFSSQLFELWQWWRHRAAANDITNAVAGTGASASTPRSARPSGGWHGC